MVKETPAAKSAADRFSKEQLLRSARYESRRDLIGALLNDGVKYSIEEVDTALKKYSKGKVK